MLEGPNQVASILISNLLLDGALIRLADDIEEYFLVEICLSEYCAVLLRVRVHDVSEVTIIKVQLRSVLQ